MSPVQTTKPFGQLYFNPPAGQVDLPEIGLGERNQRFLTIVVHFQNIGAAGLYDVGYVADVFAISSEDAAPLQLESVKRSFSSRRQPVRIDLHDCTNILFDTLD